MSGPRHSNVMRDRIDYSFWLVFDEDGSMRFSRGEPGLRQGERAMSCSLTLPRSIFRTPSLRASIDIQDPTKGTINIDVTAAAEALKQVVGCEVDLRISEA